MKIMFASDIHGDVVGAQKMLDAASREKVEKIVLLGDLLYFGPRNTLKQSYNPQAVIKLLNENKNILLCVKGNCDSEVDQMVLDFPIMADYETLNLGDKTLYLSHGHVYGKDKLPQMNEGDILLGGHTHVPEIADIDGKIYMNCGSVSIPKENSPHSYMIYENGEFLWKNLENGEVYKSFK
jgi:putative phosphoesterase